MKIINSTFRIDELIFCSVLLLYFAGMILGGMEFEKTAMFFPVTLSSIGLIFTFMYFIRGILPNKLKIVISGETKKKENIDSDEPEIELKWYEKSIFKSYILFVVTGLFVFSCYLTGFYFSTLIFLGAFLYKSRSFKGKTIIGNLVLIIVIIGTVYIFDSAFGYHFEDGSLFSFPWF